MQQSGIPSQGGRGKKISSPTKKGNSLDKWIVRKHGKVLLSSNNQTNNNKNIIINQQLDQRIKLRRQQQQRKQQLKLHGNKIVHGNLKEYGHSYSISSNSNNSEIGKKEIIGQFMQPTPQLIINELRKH